MARYYAKVKNSKIKQTEISAGREKNKEETLVIIVHVTALEKFRSKEEGEKGDEACADLL